MSDDYRSEPRMMTLEQWRAIWQRDPSADDSFVYALRGAKHFCLPSCESSKPSPERVIVFLSQDEAMTEGYVPCPKCIGRKSAGEKGCCKLVAAACAFLEQNFKSKFVLSEVASQLHVDPCYLERSFHRETGRTLLAYHNEVRLQKACQMLGDAKLTVREISERVGYVSPSHFARVFHKTIGESPTAYRMKCFSGYDEE